MKQDLVIAVVFIVYAIGMLMTFGTLLTWVERKQSAVMQDRIGANRAYIRLPFTQVKLVWMGLFHGIADGIKLLTKEDFQPRTADWYAYAVAPWVVFAPVLLVFGVVPFGGQLDPGRLFPALADWFGGRTYPMQIARLDAGLLMVFAFSGMTIIGAMLAGWASANKFSLLGGLRAGSQMISYELVMGLTVLGLILIYGTVDLGSMVTQQSATVLGVLPAWGVVMQPFAAVLFLTAGEIEQHFGTKQTDEIKGLLQEMPFSGLFLMFGTFALLGFAPFGSFIGELVMMGGMIASGQNVLFAGICVILLIVFVATGRTMFPMIWNAGKHEAGRHAEPLIDLVPKSFFLFVLLTLGIYVPGPLNELFAQITLGFGGAR